MNRRELLFLAASGLATGAVIALTPTSRHTNFAVPVDWEHVRDDGRTLSISWCGSPAFPSAQDHTWVHNHVERTFNIRLHPTFLDWPGYQSRRPLMVAGGDVPDLNWDGDPIYVRRNVHQGFVMELPYSVILEHAPAYVQYVNRFGKETWLYSRFEGRNYGIPTFAAGDVFCCPQGSHGREPQRRVRQHRRRSNRGQAGKHCSYDSNRLRRGGRHVDGTSAHSAAG